MYGANSTSCDIGAAPPYYPARQSSAADLFFNEGDYAAYVELMAEWCKKEQVEIWSYRLMPNHLIAVAGTEDGLRRAIGEAHRRYARRINFREKWRGYLWPGRFASFVMDEPYMLAATRYVELNPLRAGLVTAPCDWRWSSARAHVAGQDDPLVRVAPLLAMIPDWCAFLNSPVREEELRDIRRHARTGRPLGDESFLARREGVVGRVFQPQKRGPKPKQGGN